MDPHQSSFPCHNLLHLKFLALESQDGTGVDKKWFLGYFDLLKSSIPNVTVADIMRKLSKWKIRIVRIKPKGGGIGFTSFDFKDQVIVIEIDPGVDELPIPNRVAIMWHEILHAYFIVDGALSDPDYLRDAGVLEVGRQLQITIAATNHAYIFDSVAHTCCQMACEDWISNPMRAVMCRCFVFNRDKAVEMHERAAKAHAERARIRKEQGNNTEADEETKAAEASSEAAKVEKKKECPCCL